LAAATLCIFLYLLVQLLHSPQTEIQLPVSKPSSFKPASKDRDPQLDCMALTCVILVSHANHPMQHRANPSAHYAGSKATTTTQTTPTARASMRPSCLWCAMRSSRICCRAWPTWRGHGTTSSITHGLSLTISPSPRNLRGRYEQLQMPRFDLVRQHLPLTYVC
jgi:hypothetical protein